jgi:hypothetical protein
MSSMPLCPICKSPDVTRTKYLGGVIVWFICGQCAHVFQASMLQAVSAERRDPAARRALLCRIHSEFEEMRGLSLTLGQAARMFGLPLDIASRILERLTHAHVLRRRSNGQFVLGVEEV